MEPKIDGTRPGLGLLAVILGFSDGLAFQLGFWPLQDNNYC